MRQGDERRLKYGGERGVRHKVNASASPGGSRTAPTICRLCPAHCGVLATVEDGRLIEVTGDPDNPVFKGYTCPKGRALPEMHNDPDRLLHSQKRRPTGATRRSRSTRAMDEIAAKLRALIAEHGPRSVAIYTGTNGPPYPASVGDGLGVPAARSARRCSSRPTRSTSRASRSPPPRTATGWPATSRSTSADTWMLVGTQPGDLQVGRASRRATRRRS